jgi:hypothetical protein
MSFTLQQPWVSTSGTPSGSLSVALGSSANVGDLICVCLVLASASAVTFGVTDNASVPNTYTQVGSTYQQAGRSLSVWKSIVTTAGTFTVTATSTVSATFVLGVGDYGFASGAALTVANASGTGTGLSLATSSLSWSGNALLIGVAGNHAPPSAGTNFTAQATSVGGNASIIEDWQNVISSPQAVTMTQASSLTWAIFGVAFAEVPTIFLPASLSLGCGGQLFVPGINT